MTAMIGMSSDWLSPCGVLSEGYPRVGSVVISVSALSVTSLKSGSEVGLSTSGAMVSVSPSAGVGGGGGGSVLGGV